MSDSPPPSKMNLVSPSDERRRYPRRPAKSIPVSGPVNGELIDMSEAGFAIETRNRPSLKRRGIFRLEMGANRPDFFGQVQWVRLTGIDPLPNGESTPIYRAGIALVDREAEYE